MFANGTDTRHLGDLVSLLTTRQVILCTPLKSVGKSLRDQWIHFRVRERTQLLTTISVDTLHDRRITAFTVKEFKKIEIIDKNHPRYAEMVAFEDSIDAIRKARGKLTRAEISALGVGTPEHDAAEHDFLRDMLIALGGDPDKPLDLA